MHEGLVDQGFWEDAWVRHLEQYLSTPPRAGLWLAARFPLAAWRVLELAGGSCRDSRYLAEQGVAAIGSDFDQKTLDYLARRYPASPLVLQREDASALSLADGAVDLSMHNGFWVLFGDDAKLVQLLREQARVTRRVLVALVHNADNPRVVAAFARKAQADPLYDIRFFRRGELPALSQRARESGRRYLWNAIEPEFVAACTGAMGGAAAVTARIAEPALGTATHSARKISRSPSITKSFALSSQLKVVWAW